MENKIVYANNVQVAMQLYDVMMEFATQSPDNTRENIVRVFMSPQHTKAFAHILMDHIYAYEQTFGPIPNPPTPEELVKLEKEGLVTVTEGVHKE